MAFEGMMAPPNATDPMASMLSSSCMDFLLIELVPMVHRVTHQLDANPVGAGASANTHGGPDEDEEREAVHLRLEGLGYRVGQGLVERFSRDRPRFIDALDIIKFLCKDIWTLVFGKQVDNLKTNHRGIYVLTDATFRPICRMGTDTGGQAVVRAKPYLSFPCGLVHGSLAALGIGATVHAEITELPTVTFHIKTSPAKA